MDDLTIIHGTYPHDGMGYPWRHVRDIPVEEAMSLLHIKATELDERQMKALSEGKEVYLFLNKGYVRLDFLGKRLPIWGGPHHWCGEEAVYLHDGKYSLIEYRGPQWWRDVKPA